jgi:hypothetical protein
MLRRVALTRATRRIIPEDTILHSHRRENLKSYKETPGLSGPISRKTRQSLSYPVSHSNNSCINAWHQAGFKRCNRKNMQLKLRRSIYRMELYYNRKWTFFPINLISKQSPWYLCIKTDLRIMISIMCLPLALLVEWKPSVRAYMYKPLGNLGCDGDHVDLVTSSLIKERC